MNYVKITKNDIANGDGIRVVLWVSGCRCHCKGCQNTETWSFDEGMPFDQNAFDELIDAVSQPYIQGITFSGGHPLEPENLQQVYDIAKAVTNIPNKDIWLYTGHALTTYDFVRDTLYSKILRLCDVVVDGCFIENLRDITLKFRGSSNQRLIDVKKTLKKHEIILLD